MRNFIKKLIQTKIKIKENSKLLKFYKKKARIDLEKGLKHLKKKYKIVQIFLQITWARGVYYQKILKIMINIYKIIKLWNRNMIQNIKMLKYKIENLYI